MTPEREKYLAKCSEREKILRFDITLYKRAIKSCKKGIPFEDGRYASSNRSLMKGYKVKLNAYRHELNRLKGMDRVVVPRKAYIGAWGDKGGLCKCGKHITDVHKYCPICGRKILWEKVRK